MRNIISTNLHDDIGASLSNIHILTVLTQRNIANSTEMPLPTLRKQVMRFSASVNRSLILSGISIRNMMTWINCLSG